MPAKESWLSSSAPRVYLCSRLRLYPGAPQKVQVRSPLMAGAMPILTAAGRTSGLRSAISGAMRLRRSLWHGQCHSICSTVWMASMPMDWQCEHLSEMVVPVLYRT